MPSTHSTNTDLKFTTVVPELRLADRRSIQRHRLDFAQCSHSVEYELARYSEAITRIRWADGSGVRRLLIPFLF
jgi:hypothetical protein